MVFQGVDISFDAVGGHAERYLYAYFETPHMKTARPSILYCQEILASVMKDLLEMIVQVIYLQYFVSQKW